jgi:hypothetical protein
MIKLMFCWFTVTLTTLVILKVAVQRQELFVSTLHCRPITWLIQRQKCVTLSTTEAEFIAANEAAKELTWLSRLLHEITVLTEIPLLRVDNMSALKLVKNPTFHKRSKHIDVRYFFIGDKIEDGTLVIEHVASEEQIADIFTEPSTKDRFRKLRSLLSVNAIAQRS